MDYDSIRPYPSPERSPDRRVPHLIDYWQIVTRHAWLVVTLLLLSTLAAGWAANQQPPAYRSTLSLQVNDPWQRTRSLTRVSSVGATDVFVDPIQSEIEVLGSTPIAGAVVDSLGLRLTSTPSGTPRSALVDDVSVSREAVSGLYFVTHGPDEVAFQDVAGETIASARVGEVLDGGWIRFVPRAAPDDTRRYQVSIQPRDQAVLQVRRGITAIARESTNIIDASFTGPDPGLASRILDQAAVALRRYGALRVSGQASREVEFIEQRLDSAYVQLDRSLLQIRQFKESRAFTDLSLQEQALVTQSEIVGSEISELESQRRVLSAILRRVTDDGAGPINDIQVLAELPSSLSPQLADVVGRLQARREEVTRLVTSERKTETHPEVVALRAQISGLERELIEALGATLGVVEDRLLSANREQSNLRGQQQQFPGLENQLQTLELRQNLDRSTYEFLLSQLYQARITEAAASPYVDVLDPASQVEPIRPNRWVALVFGLLLGLSLGVGVAFFLEYLDRTLRTSSDVNATLGVPVLGVIPQLEVVAGEGASGGKTPRPLLIALDPGDPAAEAYRTLRLNLMYSDGSLNGVRTVNFTSAGPNEGKSTSALNFAVLVARQRERVLLVEADLRRPKLSVTLQIERQPGLADVLKGHIPVDAAIRREVLPNLDVLPSGGESDNPSDLLNSRAMEELLGTLESRYNYVVIDSPPILAVTDAAVLAAQADGSVLVVRSGRTDQRAARRAMEQLDRVGVRVLGAVLNEVAPNVTEESYYFKYIYSYYDDGSRRRQRAASKVAAT